MSDSDYEYETYWDVTITPTVTTDGDTPIDREEEVVEQIEDLSDEEKARLLDEALARDDAELFDAELVNWRDHAEELGMEQFE